MTDNKFYTKEKEIDGVKYVAQFNGLSTAYDCVDQSYIDGTSTTSSRKLTEFMLKHVIVEPSGLSIDDFESIESCRNVTDFAREVMQGNFRDKEVDKGTGKK